MKFEAAYLRCARLRRGPRRDREQRLRAVRRRRRAVAYRYKALQDFLFRYIAREAGRLGMAVHIHSFEGAGNFFRAAGADPLLLEPVFNDPTLRETNFVIVHGGGVYAAHAGAMLWKPNVYVDMSAMTLLYTPEKLAEVLRGWLTSIPRRCSSAPTPPRSGRIRAGSWPPGSRRRTGEQRWRWRSPT